MSSNHEAETQQSNDGSEADRGEFFPGESSVKFVGNPADTTTDALKKDDCLLILEAVRKMTEHPEPIKHQDLEKLRSFLQDDYDFKGNVNASDDSGETALHVAAEYGLHDVALILIEKFGANVLAKDGKKREPLHNACLEGHLAVVELLLGKGANLEARQCYGATPLDEACWKGHTNIVDFLLGHGAQVIVEDNDGWSPLYSASRYGHSKIVRLLLAKDCSNINHQEQEYQWTALHVAVHNGHADVIIELLCHGTLHNEASSSEAAIINKPLPCPGGKSDLHLETISQQGHTPLATACIEGFLEGAMLLINAGADINVHTVTSKATPLIISSDWGHEPIVQKLLTKDNINYNAKNKEGLTALHMACLNKYPKIVEALVENAPGIDLYTINNDEQTPLHVATQQESEEIVRLLITKMDEVDQQDEHGQTALHLASETGMVGITDMLLNKDCDAKLRDNRGRTALHIASKIGDKAIVYSLLDKEGKNEILGPQRQTTEPRMTHQGERMLVVTPRGSQMMLDIKDREGNTALHLACGADKDDQDLGVVITHLLTAGANLKDRNSDNRTAVDLIMASDMPGKFQGLLSYTCQQFHSRRTERIGSASQDWSILELLKLSKASSLLSKLISQPPRGDLALNRQTLDLALGVALDLVKDLDFMDETLCDNLYLILWMLFASSDRNIGLEAKLSETLRSVKPLYQQQEKKVSNEEGMNKDTLKSNKRLAEDGGNQKNRNVKGGMNRVMVQSETRTDDKTYSSKDLRRIHDILRDPPYAQMHRDRPELFKHPKIANKSHEPLVKQSEATLVQFYKDKGRSGTIRRYRPVKDVIYGTSKEGPTSIMQSATDGIEAMKDANPVLQEYTMSFETSPKFTWVHLPATNMDWMNDLALKIIMQGDYNEHQRYDRVQDNETKSCEKNDEDLAIPEFSEKLRKGLHRRRSVPTPKLRNRKHEFEDPDDRMGADSNSRAQASIKASALYMPYFCFSSHCEDDLDHSQDEDKFKLFVDYKKLIEGYNKSVIHGSPTLDEWYYHFSNDKESREDKIKRNREQVVTKFLSEMAKPASTNGNTNPDPNQWTVLRVNQIWVWTISDSRPFFLSFEPLLEVCELTVLYTEWIISSSSYSLDDKHIGLVEGILDQLSKQAEYGGSDSQPESAEDMSKVIVDYCIDGYDRRPMRPDCHVKMSIAQIFSNYMNMIGRRETALSETLSGWTSSNGSSSAAGTAPAASSGRQARRADEVTRGYIEDAQQLFYLIKDIRDELNILKSVSRFQKIVQKSLTSNLGIMVKDEELSADYVQNDISEMDIIADRIQSAVYMPFPILTFLWDLD
ncbi:ankyrin unc44 [Fusarium beomiforme]|uniref:Ankyrin unc44 n=1 Tax=Fusarium beomiforme TaxID=44412 RepID=A0A9P5AJL8_9HYPO|nr:ankyrin unc44 [Fusarium beomiforme]